MYESRPNGLQKRITVSFYRKAYKLQSHILNNWPVSSDCAAAYWAIPSMRNIRIALCRKSILLILCLSRIIL